MSEISDLSSILQNSLLLYSTNNNNKENQLQKIQEKLDNIPTTLDKNTLTRLNNGEFGISLKEYTQINTYNTMMTALYGNNSANKFQNTLNILTNSAENELANAKTFVETMQERGMSPKAAVNTLIALQKYSLMSSYGNYNYINANA
jgi:hypothetical protein